MNLTRLLRELFSQWKLLPWLSLGIVATVALDAAFETALPLVFSWLVDHAVVPQRFDLFLLPVALLLGGWVISLVNQLSRDALFAVLTSRVLQNLRLGLDAFVRQLGFADLKSLKASQLLNLYSADLLLVENFHLNVLPSILFGVFYLVLGLAAMLATHAGLGLAVLLVLPLTLVGPWLTGRHAVAAGEQAQQAGMTLASHAQETLAAQPAIRTFDLGAAFQHSFREKAERLERWSRSFYFLTNLTRRLPNVVIHLMQLVLLVVGAWLTLQGQLNLGELIAFNLLFANVMTAVLDLSVTIAPMLQTGLALERLRKHQAPITSPPEAPKSLLPPLKHHVRLKEVSFHYPNRPWVLKDLDLELVAGTRTAIVGGSGSGKSTLTALLMGLYSPEAGSLFWDDIELNAQTWPALRGKLGVVFQDNTIFDESLLKNLLLETEKPGDRERARVALTQAGLAAWVDALPEGLETRAGENGGFLSGGQRQRLALARALLRTPELLILDEATSALDPTTEALVNDTLRALAGQTTIVHVTHRLESIIDYDRIVVLGNGAIQEVGRHDELVKHGGLYAQLWNRQSGLILTPDGSHAHITPEGLRAIPLFASSSEATLKDLARSFVSTSAAPGERVIHQGRPGSQFFVVARGKVEVSIRNQDGEAVVATLTDGEYFGEMSLLEQVLTSANVTATQATLLLSLEKTTFLTLLATDPHLHRAIHELAALRKAANAARAATKT